MPDPGIAERDRHEAACSARVAPDRRHAGDLFDPYRQRALAVHGIARVHRHVDQGGLELADISFDQTALAG